MDLIEQYIAEKTAGPWGSVGRTARDVASGAGKKVLEEIPKGVGGGAAALMVGAAGAAVSKIHDALTKRRDFRAMLEHNPHLNEAQAADPKRFNQLYSTLRTFNPAFAADPIVAGTYMDRMWQNPGGAGAIATEALTARDKIPHPVGEMFQQGVLKGISSRNEGGGGGGGAGAPPPEQGGPHGPRPRDWRPGEAGRSGGFAGPPRGAPPYRAGGPPTIVPLGGGMSWNSWQP